MTPLRRPIAECPVPISSHLFRDRLEYARSVRPRTYFFGTTYGQACLSSFISSISRSFLTPAHFLLGPAQLAVLQLHVQQVHVLQVADVAAHRLVGEAGALGQVLLADEAVGLPQRGDDGVQRLPLNALRQLRSEEHTSE